MACDAIVTSPVDPDANRSIMKAIIGGANVYYNFTGNTTCLNLDSGDDIGADMWDYQVGFIIPLVRSLTLWCIIHLR